MISEKFVYVELVMYHVFFIVLLIKGAITASQNV